MRSRLLKLWLVLLMLSTFTAVTEAADKVRISIGNLSGQFMTFPLAHKRGFLKEEGVDSEIIRVTGGATGAALSSGDLDYGTGMTLGGAISGLPVKVVACFVPAPVLAMVARPDQIRPGSQRQDDRRFHLCRRFDLCGTVDGQTFWPRSR